MSCGVLVERRRSRTQAAARPRSGVAPRDTTTAATRLAPLVVGQADDGDVGDRGMRAAARPRSRPARGSRRRARSRRRAGPRDTGSRRRRASRRPWSGTSRRRRGRRRPRYSPDTCSPRTQISPARPAATGWPLASRISTSIVGSGRPTEPSRRAHRGSSLASAARWSSGASTAIVELVSVSPYALTKSTCGSRRSARSIDAARASRPPP